MTVKITRGLGFTLMEVMLVVVIVAILAAVAVPSYLQHVQSSRRSEARTQLVRIANLEESYFLDNSQYGSLMSLGLTATSGATYTTENGFYAIGVTLSGTSAYTLTATASGAQASDTLCATLSLTQDGTKSSSTGTVDQCWK